MTPAWPAVIVGVGGAAGAVARHVVSTLVDVESYPLGTLTVNVLGSFLLGLVAFGGLARPYGLLLGTGAAGSFTTFSSFSFETVRLWETGERVRAVVNGASTLLGSLLALWVARVLTIWLA
ncbi:MAG: fluoride efflux transporter CrcB [Halanaeroarchaeum sp.]